MRVNVYLPEGTEHAKSLKLRGYKWCTKDCRWEKSVRALRSVLEIDWLRDSLPKDTKIDCK